jgi:peroxiredoxin
MLTDRTYGVESRNPQHTHDRRVALAALILIVALPILMLSYLHAKLNSQPLPIGKTIPLVNLMTFSEKRVALDSLRNSKTVLMIFSAECPHCIRMLSVFQAVKQQFGKGVKFVALSVSKPDTTMKLLSKTSVSFPVFLDKNNVAQKQFRPSMLPATFFIDSGLVLRNELFGEVSQRVVEQAVKSLIAGK